MSTWAGLEQTRFEISSSELVSFSLQNNDRVSQSYIFNC